MITACCSWAGQRLSTVGTKAREASGVRRAPPSLRDTSPLVASWGGKLLVCDGPLRPFGTPPHSWPRGEGSRAGLHRGWFMRGTRNSRWQHGFPPHSWPRGEVPNECEAQRHVADQKPYRRCPLLTRFVSRYLKLWGLGVVLMGRRSSMVMPASLSPSTLEGLFVISTILSMPSRLSISAEMS